MHHEYQARYIPTSPLSPRMNADQNHLAPTTSRHTAGRSKLSPRKFHMQLPAYDANLSGHNTPASPNSRVQSPAINLNQVLQPTPMDMQRSMGKGQRELIRQLKLSSQMAASSMANRPDAPRLDPLGSPKGPVTPLALEQEPSDYFTIARAGKLSPVASPGGRSSRSDGSDKDKKKTSDLYA